MAVKGEKSTVMAKVTALAFGRRQLLRPLIMIRGTHQHSRHMVWLDHQLPDLFSKSVSDGKNMLLRRHTIQSIPDTGLSKADEAKNDSLERSTTVEAMQTLI